MSEPLRVGVVGTGAMGRHHVRLLSANPEASLVGVCDLRTEVAEKLASEYGCRAFAALDDLLAAVDALVVAVPTTEHADLACRALHAGRHVLVEKPMAVDLEEADRMIAAARGAKLAVGHVEFFNPAVQRLLALSTGPRFIEIERISKFTPRSLDVDVILDLMIHDLQIVHALDPSDLVEIRGLGIDVLTPQVDIASARLELASGCVVNLTASRVSEEAKRRLRVFFGDSYYSLDFKEQTIKGFRLDEAIRAGRAPISKEAILPGEVTVEEGEPLRGEIESFVRVCRGEDVPWVDGVSARRALETAVLVRRAVDERREILRDIGRREAQEPENAERTS